MSDRADALGLVPVSHETLERLETYVALLQKWQKTTNLIAPSTLPQIWTRHVADSLQLTALAPNALKWLDIGSGGGFPGVVIACALARTQNAKVHLVERNGKKAAFLREAIRITGAAGTVYCGDIVGSAATLPQGIDIVTARAVAPLTDLVAMALPWMNRGSKALFHKGLEVEQELKDNTISSMYDVRVHKSVTGDGNIVEIAPTPPRLTS